MDRKENAQEAADRLRREALQEAGQACVDWAQDMGECHLCGFDEDKGTPHDDECPIRKLTARPKSEVGGCQDNCC